MYVVEHACRSGKSMLAAAALMGMCALESAQWTQSQLRPQQRRTLRNMAKLPWFAHCYIDATDDTDVDDITNTDSDEDDDDTVAYDRRNDCGDNICARPPHMSMMVFSSLQGLYQFSEEYITSMEMSGRLRRVDVCSNGTTGEDILAETMRKARADATTPTVFLTTYTSLPKLHEALLRASTHMDVAVFDEAHNVHTPQNHMLCGVANPEDMRKRKDELGDDACDPTEVNRLYPARLYLTATPRAQMRWTAFREIYGDHTDERQWDQYRYADLLKDQKKQRKEYVKPLRVKVLIGGQSAEMRRRDDAEHPERTVEFYDMVAILREIAERQASGKPAARVKVYHKRAHKVTDEDNDEDEDNEEDEDEEEDVADADLSTDKEDEDEDKDEDEDEDEEAALSTDEEAERSTDKEDDEVAASSNSNNSSPRPRHLPDRRGRRRRERTSEEAARLSARVAMGKRSAEHFVNQTMWQQALAYLHARNEAGTLTWAQLDVRNVDGTMHRRGGGGEEDDESLQERLRWFNEEVDERAVAAKAPGSIRVLLSCQVFRESVTLRRVDLTVFADGKGSKRDIIQSGLRGAKADPAHPGEPLDVLLLVSADGASLERPDGADEEVHAAAAHDAIVAALKSRHQFKTLATVLLTLMEQDPAVHEALMAQFECSGSAADKEGNLSDSDNDDLPDSDNDDVADRDNKDASHDANTTPAFALRLQPELTVTFNWHKDTLAQMDATLLHSAAVKMGVSDRWDDLYMPAFRKFFRKHDNLNVPTDEKMKVGDVDVPLGRLVNCLRTGNQKIPPKWREELIGTLGLDLSNQLDKERDRRWNDEIMPAFREFFRKHTHVNVPKDDTVKVGDVVVPLGQIVNSLRSVARRRRRKIPQKWRTELFDTLRLDLSNQRDKERDRKWKWYMPLFREIHRRNGHVNVSNSVSMGMQAAAGDRICFAGLATGIKRDGYHGWMMGQYTRQEGHVGGRVWYKGGRDGDCAVWYHAGKKRWYVGLATNVGTINCDVYARSTAATPEGIPVGKWRTTIGTLVNHLRTKLSKIPPEYAAELKELGLDLSNQRDSNSYETWRDVYMPSFREFYRKHGNLNVPLATDIIGRVVSELRNGAKKIPRPEYEAELVDKYGLDLSNQRDKEKHRMWTEKVMPALRAYHRRYGHLIVPSTEMCDTNVDASAIRSRNGGDFKAGDNVKFDYNGKRLSGKIMRKRSSGRYNIRYQKSFEFEGVSIGRIMLQVRHLQQSIPEHAVELNELGIVWNVRNLASHVLRSAYAAFERLGQKAVQTNVQTNVHDLTAVLAVRGLDAPWEAHSKDCNADDDNKGERAACAAVAEELERVRTLWPKWKQARTECKLAVWSIPFGLKAELNKRSRLRERYIADLAKLRAEHKKQVDKAAKATTDRIDRILKPYNLRSKDVGAEGDCQFRALAHHIRGKAELHPEVRTKVVEELHAHSDWYKNFVEEWKLGVDDADENSYASFVKRMARPHQWGGHVTLYAAANAYGRTLHVVAQFGRENKSCYLKLSPRQVRGPDIWLTYMNGNHYRATQPLDGKTPTVSGDARHETIEKRLKREATAARKKARKAVVKKNFRSTSQGPDDGTATTATTCPKATATTETTEITEAIETPEAPSTAGPSAGTTTAAAATAATSSRKRKQQKTATDASAKKKQKKRATTKRRKGTGGRKRSTPSPASMIKRAEAKRAREAKMQDAYERRHNGEVLSPDEEAMADAFTREYGGGETYSDDHHNDVAHVQWKQSMNDTFARLMQHFAPNGGPVVYLDARKCLTTRTLGRMPPQQAGSAWETYVANPIADNAEVLREEVDHFVQDKVETALAETWRGVPFAGAYLDTCAGSAKTIERMLNVLLTTTRYPPASSASSASAPPPPPCLVLGYTLTPRDRDSETLVARDERLRTYVHDRCHARGWRADKVDEQFTECPGLTRVYTHNNVITRFVVVRWEPRGPATM